MKIAFVEIQNFRKLKSCRIDFADRETIFVGANNSGKTSAMDALMFFLKEKSKFTTKDFTLSNWRVINTIGSDWCSAKDDKQVDLSIEKWQELIPQLDVWLQVEATELQYISHLIPTLDWNSGLLGVRLRLEPKNIEALYKDFTTAFASSKTTKDAAQEKRKRGLTLKLWPTTMWDFLERRLQTHFDIKAFLLDPSKVEKTGARIACPQAIPIDSVPLDRDPFDGLIKVDIINAQRGFSDINTDTGTVGKTGNLSAQLKDYYARHLNPEDKPNPEDIDALQSIDDAKTTFDEKLRMSFDSSLKELENLNYPGFGNPTITISSKVSAIDGLNHNSAVLFDVMKRNGDKDDDVLSLPEKSNGLGYQNLISMVFKLIRFRDEWMQTGKSVKETLTDEQFHIEPLHLILIEEPEAHLHAQVQQVFIRKAYVVLRNHPLLADNKFTTQLIVSTHSNHIAHEIDFTSLRYFKRVPRKENDVATSVVINLSSTFGSEDDTSRFTIRYLKTTHCDLFFADAVILIEGPAERMLLPHFIKHFFPDLTSAYVSILEIGGSHAHKLKPLIQDLGIITLVITDLDSFDPAKKSTVVPERNKKLVTINNTLKSWIPVKETLDELFQLDQDSKISKDYPIRVAYQYPVTIVLEKNKTEEVIPYTFEDALVYQNVEFFKSSTGNGLFRKFAEALDQDKIAEISQAIATALEKGKKAEFALELLFMTEPRALNVPQYICDGLEWLSAELKKNH